MWQFADLNWLSGGGATRRFQTAAAFIALVLCVGAVPATPDDAQSVPIKGYVLDSACAFTKDLAKPISKQCATACAKAGSPMVILADDGAIYWPIAAETPASGQNAKLLPFAGDQVVVRGKVYQRAGSRAIVIEKIEGQSPQK